MPSKTFSARADVDKLQYVEAVVNKERHMSFGRYCGTALVDYICRTGKLPETEDEGTRHDSVATMRQLAEKHAGSMEGTNAGIALMNDAEIRDLIAGRYA